MAKKVTIQGSNLLQNLNDDWGGVNNSQGSVTPYSGQGASTPVPAGAEWGVNRGEVERFIKDQLRNLNGKIGFVTWSSEVDASNFYHLWGFATEDDYHTYLEDMEEHENLLKFDVPLPISTVQGDSYGSYLFTNANTTLNIVLTEPSFSVGLRFHAVRNSNGDRLNMGTKGNLQIERSLDNGVNWSRVATITGAIDSTDYSNTSTYTTIQLGQYLAKGYQQLLRVRAYYVYTDESDQNRTLYSTWVSVAGSITYTELSLVCELNWQNAIQSSQYKNSGFPVSYTVNGLVEKTLHVLIYGNAQNPLEATYNLDASVNGTIFTRNITDAADTYKIFDHGVHKIEAWLTASDGHGGTLSSPHVENNIMVIDYTTAAANGTIMKPYIMLQGFNNSVVNYVQTRICEYAIFNPQYDETNHEITADDDAVEVGFYLTSYSEQFPSGTYETYYQSIGLIEPNVRHSLTTTIEIERDSTEDIETYFRVWSTVNNVQNNMLLDSTGEVYLNITVDNTENFSPTANPSFVLNPKTRNNTEVTPKRIVNAVTNTVVASTWDGFDMNNDGWVTDSEGVKVLRVVAGERLSISLNPFLQFRTSPNSAMTMEFDMSVRNVTNEDDAVVQILETVAGDLYGLSIRPMEGNMFTKSNTEPSETNFRFCEDKRTHIAININNRVSPNNNGDGLYPSDLYNPAPNIALVRILINGVVEREMKFSVSDVDEFCTPQGTNNKLVIGQDGCDVDIYGIRIYANSILTPQDVVKDYISTLPTTAEKLYTRSQNDILTNGRVDVEKVKALGKRVLILHGDEPYFHRTSVNSIWWEIFQYNDDGSLNPDLSGTICRETGMPPSRQGSTANTYYYSNIQTKIDDKIKVNGVKTTRWIYVDPSAFHSSITVSQPYTADYEDPDTEVVTQNATVVDIMGGNLGKNEPVVASMQAKKYLVVDGRIRVPDGWIDGNGLYRGMGFMVTEGTPLATKLVLKVNYASSMQTHLCAGTRLYSDLHTAVVGRNSLQQAVPTARVAKYTEPVYFFTQADGSDDVVYRGGGNFGAGKMDKPTWGYVKSLHPMFTMIEGSDNNYPLTDMRVPFTIDGNCSESITYSTDDEGYFYAGLQNLDFDAGKTNDDETPHSTITNRLADTWNFIYLHTPMLRYFAGTFSQFLLSDESSNTTYKYWCTDGDDRYKLKRYNFVDGVWVDAGLWNGSSYDTIDIRTNEMTAATYTASTHKADYAILNKEIIGAIVAHAKKYIGFYFNIKSLQFHYVFQNHFMAGTDNCSKNTYYVIDPVAKSVTIDGETRSCYLWELHQDDVDTIFITDNNGRSTKPYYIDRMHPYNDKDTSENPTSCYEGTMNGLFNLVEAMWEDTKELQSMLKSVFTAMVGLTSSTPYDNSIWGCLEMYFFSIQHFYSQMAYNEQARVRYEWPALLGFISSGSGARNIPPITQSMGSQLEAETQFMLRRVIYMASYAAWGQLYDGGKTYNIGITDVGATFSVQAFHLPGYQSNENNYTFSVKPHQYIYPTGMLGQTSVDPHVRVAPGQTYALNLGSTESNDTGLSILGINYYSSLGNVGDISVAPSVTFTVVGKRLTEFIAEPTVTYTENDKQVGAFRPNRVVYNASLLRALSLKNSGIGGTADLSGLSRIETIDIRGTNVTSVTLPPSVLLRSIELPATLTSLSLISPANLQTLTLEGTSNLHFLSIYGDSGGHGYSILSQCYNDEAPLNTIYLSGEVWDDPLLAVVTYVTAVQNKDIKLRINFVQSYLDIAMKMELMAAFGDVDDPNNEVYVTYQVNTIQAIAVEGVNFVFVPNTTHKMSLRAIPANGNNVKAIAWSCTNPTYATIDQSGNLTVLQVGTAADQAMTTVTCTVTRMDNTPISASKVVRLYEPQLSVGDYIFSDGSYAPEISGGGGLTAIGRCFYISEDGTDRRMVSLATVGTGVWGLHQTVTLSTGSVAQNIGCSDGTIASRVGSKTLGKYNTELIISRRNRILGDSNINLPIPEVQAVAQNRTAMDCLLDDIQSYDSQKNYYYIPASMCNAYEPTIRATEQLNERFKAGNWYLPIPDEITTFAQSLSLSSNITLNTSVEQNVGTGSGQTTGVAIVNLSTLVRSGAYKQNTGGYSFFACASF